MDRRHFLRLTGGSAAAAALTAWLAPGCGRREEPEAASSEEPPEVLDPRRPLLAVLVPKDEVAGYERGRWIGGILNHGGDRVLAALAGVELVCSTADRLPEAARAAASDDAVWFVSLIRDGTNVRARALTLEAPPEPPTETAAQVRKLADALYAFLAPGTDAAPADVAKRAALARKRYVAKPPPGAHWANYWGCVEIFVEGVRHEPSQISCGMAMVPDVAQRFLHFYVKGRGPPGARAR